MLGQLGRVAMWQGDPNTGLKHVGEALELSRRTGDRVALVFNLRQMGNMLTLTRPSEARPYLEESVKLARELGDQHSEASALNSMGISYQLEGRSQEARAAFGRALEINRTRGDRAAEAMVLSNLSALYSVDGDFEAAERTAKESISLAREIGAIAILPTGQATLAEIYLRQGNDGEARRWIREASETMRAIGSATIPLVLLYGLLELRTGDRSKGLSWIGFARAHDPNQRETRGIIDSFRELIHGSDSEEAVETALRTGEGLTLEGILEEAERAPV